MTDDAFANETETDNPESRSSGTVTPSDESTPLLGDGNRAKKWKRYSLLFNFVVDNAMKTNTWLDNFCAIAAVLCQLLSLGCELLKPLMLKGAIDGLNSKDVHSHQWVPYLYVAGFIGFGILDVVFSDLKDVAYQYVVLRKKKDLETASFSHIHSMNLSYLYMTKMGQLGVIVGNGISSIESITNSFLFEVVPLVLGISVVMAVFMRLKSGGIVAVIICAVSLHLVINFLSIKKLCEIVDKLIDSAIAVNSKERESLECFEIIKCFGAEKREVKQYDELILAYNVRLLENDKFRSMTDILKNVVSYGGLGMTLALSARSVIKGGISPGSFVAINTYYYQLFDPLTSIGDVYRGFETDLADLSKFMEFILTVPEIRDRPDATPLQLDTIASPDTPMIEFRNVSLVYEKDKSTKHAVRNISFKVSAGEKIALVGCSGSGKTSCARLVLRLFEATRGEVLINGLNVKQIKIASLREQIGVVSQETVLYNETLRYNIAFGKPDAADEEIYGVACLVALDKFIDGLKDGLDSICGSRGVKLSGGERQRVGIARMIIRNPKLVVLDETTSSLDSLVERKVQHSLDELTSNDGRTTIVIAHRLSTIMRSDQILVFDKGEICERGTHASLLKVKGLYHDMWMAQNGLKPDDFQDQENESQNANSH